MDLLPDLHKITEWLIAYGPIFIFVAFALGILILPVPEETLMLVAGALIKKNKLNFFTTALGAALGAMVGITLSYVIGRTFGLYFLHKYGKWVGFTQKRIKKAHDWFEKYGKWTLVIGYYIPGVRHFTGITAGATNLSYKQFGLFAYLGAVSWVMIFLTSGYFLGHVGVKFFEQIEFTFDNMIMMALALALIIFVSIVIYKKVIKKKR